MRDTEGKGGFSQRFKKNLLCNWKYQENLCYEQRDESFCWRTQNFTELAVWVSLLFKEGKCNPHTSNIALVDVSSFVLALQLLKSDF